MLRVQICAGTSGQPASLLRLDNTETMSDATESVGCFISFACT